MPGGAPTEFERRGFQVLRGVVPEVHLSRVEAAAATWSAATGAVETETAVGYPGAARPGEAGAETVRRHLAVYDRDPAVSALLRAGVAGAVATLLADAPVLVLAHHNCLMTKEPRHSSDTPWHRDLRYWSFTLGELVTAWIPLGPERPENGCLEVVPGSHRRDLPKAAFDGERSLPANHPATAGALPVELDRGDLLLFHCRLLHRATRNRTDRAKRSLVFTFRRCDDRPVPGTRSASGGDVAGLAPAP